MTSRPAAALLSLLGFLIGNAGAAPMSPEATTISPPLSQAVPSLGTTPKVPSLAADALAPPPNPPAAAAAPASETPAPAGEPPAAETPSAAAETAAILGVLVHGRAGSSIGRIVDVLVDKDGVPRGAVIDSGGFMGVGSRRFFLDWHDLRFNPDSADSPIKASKTSDEIKALPDYKGPSHPAPNTASAPLAAAPPPSAAEPPPSATGSAPAPAPEPSAQVPGTPSDAADKPTPDARPPSPVQ